MQEKFDFSAMEDALRRSWEIHRQAFGPILEPAFVENPQVRVHLINALNHISRREVQRGMELLQEIRPHCIYDEDKAAWTFFVGVCYEMSGAKAQMLQWYADAGKFGHRFYMPYMKLAKAAHNGGQFEVACGYYETAVECLLEMSEAERSDVILGSAYTNLTSCLTMLHRYDQAQAAWRKAQQCPLQPGADATAAILYAAMGDREKTAQHLRALEEKFPVWLSQTRTMTEQILAGQHPDFPPKGV